ncbi:MAG: CvpA family protein [Patescibacteria group bacterium]|nr:CvpA family protein [Patescibacteria group bacterium]
MPIFDVILLVVLTIFAVWGFFFGFIQAFGSLAGLILGVLAANKYYLLLASWLGFIPVGETAIKIISFFTILILISKLTGLAFYFIDKFFHLISIIPFLKTINRILGGILGFIEGFLIIGVFLYIAHNYSINLLPEEMISDSKLTPIALNGFEYFIDLLQPIFQKVKNLIY